MIRIRGLLFTALAAASLSACNAAEADQQPAPPVQVAMVGTGPRMAIAIAPERMRAPYDVQIMRDNGETLPTYAAKDRFYVQGNAGERYILRITNPTPNRVEAVVSVDGIDVIDGEAGDLHKRGYIVPAYGETRVEGFRTSTSDVATFRFSSVDGSYAGQQGKPRNVGVVAVALFEEQPQAQIVEPAAPPPSQYRYEDDVIQGGVGEAQRKGYDGPHRGYEGLPAPTTTASNGAATAVGKDGGGASVGAAGRAAAPSLAPPPPPAMPMKVMRRPPSDSSDSTRTEDTAVYDRAPSPSHTERPGLGTQFGEQRYSSVSFTRFVRASDRPVAIAELRYNDVAGLLALGIPVQQLPGTGEIMTRETADPFPGDRGFARPAR